MKKILSGLLLWAAALNAQAVLVDNGASVTDTTTGYEWLDLSETTNMSFNEVLAQLGSGGLFADWLLAGTDEIYTLFDAAGGNGSYSGGSSYSHTTGHNALRVSLLSTWGNGSAHVSSDDIWFHIEDYTPGSTTTGFVLQGDSMRYYPDGFSTPTYPYNNIGTALYRVAATVPEPSALLLMGLGLLGLGFSRRTRS